MSVTPRTTSILLYLRLVLAVALIVLPAFDGPADGQIPWVAALAAHLVVWTLAIHTGRPLMETSETGLDEREVGIRNSASWWGLTTACGLTSILALVSIVAADRAGPFFEALASRSGYILVGITLTSLSIPSIVGHSALEREEPDSGLFVDIDDDDDSDVA